MPLVDLDGLDIIDAEIVQKELESLYYDRWRTIDSLVKTSGYTVAQIQYLFDEYLSDKIIRTKIQNLDGGVYVYSTRKHYNKTHSFCERILTAMNGKFIL